MAGTVCSVCGNTAGRFTMRGESWYCVPSCIKSSNYRDTAKSTFPFVATHMRTPSEGGPIEVQNMRQLRQLENRYGAQSEIYNNDSSYQGGRY